MADCIGSAIIVCLVLFPLSLVFMSYPNRLTLTLTLWSHSAAYTP
jgi:hypothetical protein